MLEGYAAMIDIFDNHGRIRTDIDPQTVPQDRRGAFTALIAAHIACESAEANEKAADRKVAECVKVHDAAVAACPRSTFMDEWRTMVGQR